MSPFLLLSIVFGYFLLLLGIAWYTSRGAGEHAFYSGERKSLWYVVAFGMIGTSLSGVTFISVPGMVQAKGWTYLQLVIGFAIGYWIVAGVLLPLYYRLQLTSIYGYLRERFGMTSYRTGAAFFILSRLAGATIRIYVVLNVIQLFVLDAMGVPFELTAFVVLLMIVLYTLKGGVKTIVWTDTLQTLFMLGALIGTIVFITNAAEMVEWRSFLSTSGMTGVINTDWRSDGFFLKQILAGIFITIAMTGLDQEMMQKNLSVATVGDAKKNMRVFSVVLLGVNVLFLLLGALLYLFIYSGRFGAALPMRPDDVFPTMALNYFPTWLGLLFIIGLISALFPSADGALTALTASTCIDLIGIRDRGWDEARQKQVRQRVHLGMAVLFLAFVLYFHWLATPTVIKTLFDVAGFTYGPLLGLFAYGLFFKGKPTERWVPVICIAAPIFTYFIRMYSKELLFGYQMGFEVLLVVAAITMVGLAVLGSEPGDRKEVGPSPR
ncbi:MAG: sodium:solute symporter [Flavobacteriales bacterium]|nr:sodium:solute symporter [Flavobacteriales bacterium]